MTNAVPTGLEALSKKFGLTIRENGTENGTTNGASSNESSDDSGNLTPENSSTATEEVKQEAKEETKPEAKEEKKSETADAEPGTITDTKNIYKSKKDDDGNWTWVSEYPEDTPEAAENDETAKFAIVVRNQKSKDSRKKLEADSIVIQSPWLKKALGEILKDYPGVTCELKRLVFEAPFEPFVHRWSDFLKYQKRRDLDSTTKAHLNLLHDVLKYEIGDAIKAFEDYVLNGVITYQNLWLVFQPGGIVLSSHKGPLSAFELERYEYMSNQCGNFFQLSADCVDWNGRSFGRCGEKISIAEFPGTRKISNLHVYPLPFCKEKEEVKRHLTERGKKFEELAGHWYKSYEGAAITWDREGNEQPIQVSGRIIVDIDSFNRFSPYRVRWLEDFNAKDLQRLSDYRMSNPALFAEQEEKKEKEKSKKGPTIEQPQRAKLSPYHHLLCRSRTRGYSLKLKKWLDFFVEVVQDITWNTNAFNSLVLAPDQKDLILAFSESQVENRAAFDDVISGKGKGIIMLLSGPPGVGKTLTAEAVAENMQVPLHTISSGDLGSSPWEVENGLSNILELVARWNAVLLLDECDVFLEARSAHDLERNKIVSIFLRTLEYYEGILFMTTNRVDNIDLAFQSRIHISMEYPDLTTDSRRQIWKNFLLASKQQNEFSEDDLTDLSEVVLNGRQIKNILKSAQLLASRKGEKLNRRFVETVLAIENRRPKVKS